MCKSICLVSLVMVILCLTILKGLLGMIFSKPFIATMGISLSSFLVIFLPFFALPKGGPFCKDALFWGEANPRWMFLKAS